MHEKNITQIKDAEEYLQQAKIQLKLFEDEIYIKFDELKQYKKSIIDIEKHIKMIKLLKDNKITNIYLQDKYDIDYLEDYNIELDKEEIKVLIKLIKKRLQKEIEKFLILKGE